jgi:trehalose 6-phosphate phosphatase
MRKLKPNGDLQLFLDRLAKSKDRALLLDYDGTLAPFQVERDQAFPYAGVREILDTIIENDESRVVIISGRWTKDLVPLLGLKKIPEIWGSHGLERLSPDGKYKMDYLEEQHLQGLKEALDWAESKGHLDRCEKKPGSVALHWRGMNSKSITSLRSIAKRSWNKIASKYGLDIREFDGGLEIRTAANKGEVIKKLLTNLEKDVVMAYLGDDLTDEDAFKAIGDRGLSILVRPEFRSTKAQLWLKPPEELLEFLDKWDSTCRKK